MSSPSMNEAGFTLIELLVVIVILGILAAVVVFAVGSVTDKGEGAAEKADRQTIVHAEEAFFANLTPGHYASESALVPKYISDPSTLHDVCLSGDAKAYEVILAGASCPDGMTLAS